LPACTGWHAGIPTSSRMPARYTRPLATALPTLSGCVGAP